MTKATKKKAANDNARPLTFVSMFSGIEAASVAFGPLGWSALAFAEIEKFPSAVLAHHYPDVPNVGDMTAHDWSRYRGKADIVCGGPPCQAFSVAGLRNSMDDARGNLSLAYMRAIHAIKPRNAITENVPGWLSTKDNAFGCFLAGLVGADDALPPPDGRRWPDAGMVSGPQGRAAWRILDAQFFGLAQRRRRVIVVADFGNGADPAAVLFERKGMSWNPAPSREEGEGVAPTISARTKGGGGLGTDFDLDGGLVEYAPEIARCDATREGSSQDYESTTMVAVSATGTIAHTLKAEGHDASEDGSGRGVPIVVHGTQDPCVSDKAFAQQGNAGQENVICFTAKDYGGGASVDISPTLRSGTHDKSHANGGVVPAVTVALRGRDSGGTAELGGSVATALRASSGGGDKPHVLAEAVYSIMPQNSGKDYKARKVDVAQPLMAGGPVGGNQGGDFVLQSAVRRLTPVECERLQGFPDGYTNIPWRGKQESPDGPRYKALGNSWAVPKFLWIGERIARLMPADNDNQERQVGDAA